MPSFEKSPFSTAIPLAALQYDAELEGNNIDKHKVLRKLDIRLLPLFSLLYVLSLLDRTNIGNAKVAGLVADLRLTGLQYNVCTAMFFITYAFFEVPSNVALKLLSASRWVPLIMFLWGCVMVSMAFVKNFEGLLVARVILGITEAGMFPGVTFYLCSWYPRASQAQRISVFAASTSVAGAFGGVLAYEIEKMNGIGGLAGWSWIFLLEGLATACVAILSYFLLYDYPENATFLTETERSWLTKTIKRDNTGLSKSFKWKFLRQALWDPRAYLMVAIYLFVIIPGYAYTLFLPTIINGLGFSASRAQLLSVPPNAAGFVTTIIFGILSDKCQVRGPFVLAGTMFLLVGYIVLYATSTPEAGYAGVMIAALGVFPCIAITLAWTGANFAGETKKAVVIAMVIGLGNLGGVASSFIYRAQDSPRYRPGHATNIACSSVALVLVIINMLELARQNRKKTVQCEAEGITDDKASEYVDMGDVSPLYRYII